MTYFIIKETEEAVRAYGPGDSMLTKRTQREVLGVHGTEAEALEVAKSYSKPNHRIYVAKAVSLTTNEPRTEKL